MSTFRTYLRLGRVSNLPTVWTNVLAGAGLSGAALGAGRLALLMVALSLFYVAGMYLNDAFDRHIDARERPTRPIPAGEIGAGRVFGIGFALLGAGFLLVAGTSSPKATAAALVLAAAIVLYDVWHKGNPISPLLMGMCRVLVYAVVALAVSDALSAAVGRGALALLCYLVGLTYIAKQETLERVKNLWPLGFLFAPLVLGFEARVLPCLFAAVLAVWAFRALRVLRSAAPGAIPRAVAFLLAGISWVDGLLLAADAPVLALACVPAVPLTLFFQRYIAGT